MTLRVLVTTSLATAILLGFSSFTLYAQSDDETLEWESSYAAAIARAKLTKQPILFEVRCGP
jgi:hypothetical protein